MSRTTWSVVLFVALAVPQLASGQTTVTFENGTVPIPLTTVNSIQNGANFTPAGSFSASGAVFNNSYDSTFDSWSGWSYSNVTNTTMAGFGNQYAAYNVPGGTGDGSANYGVAFQAFDFVPPFAPVVTPTATLPANHAPQSIRITNTTYAAISMRDGDSFAKKFGGVSGNDPDFFRLTITGRNAGGGLTGSVDFYLADYRFANNALDYIVDRWTTVDLSSLGADTATLSFDLASSDVGSFGINTPTYFAADNLVLTPVPEPATVGLVAVAAIAAYRRVRRRRGADFAGCCDTPPVCCPIDGNTGGTT